ncbi:MAG: acyl-CoA dehydrogenase family protein, partial [Gammaproteobacteria bacterium]
FAEMETKYRLNSAFIKECLNLFQTNSLDTGTASMAKLASTEAQCEIADTCLQMFGGYGYMKEYPISRAFADARIQKIYGGTSEIMLELISRDSFSNKS